VSRFYALPAGAPRQLPRRGKGASAIDAHCRGPRGHAVADWDDGAVSRDLIRQDSEPRNVVAASSSRSALSVVCANGCKSYIERRSLRAGISAIRRLLKRVPRSATHSRSAKSLRFLSLRGDQHALPFLSCECGLVFAISLHRVRSYVPPASVTLI
jgi:hypothetical protein